MEVRKGGTGGQKGVEEGSRMEVKDMGSMEGKEREGRR